MAEVRPIDANALVSAFNTDLQTAMISWSTDLLQALIIEIEEAPILDYAPVMLGKWKYYHKQNRAVCTACSFERNLDDDFGRAISCPNCGARMDGGQHD